LSPGRPLVEWELNDSGRTDGKLYLTLSLENEHDNLREKTADSIFLLEFFFHLALT